MIDVAIKLCSSALDIFLKKNEMDRNHKERISNLLNEISEILQMTANDLKQDIYPHGNCEILYGLSTKLSGYLYGIIPEEDLEKLIDALVESSKIESQFSIRKEPETIPRIERASGEFKIMSMLLTVK